MRKLKQFFSEKTANAPLQGYGYLILLLGVFLIAMECAHIFMTYLDVTEQLQNAVIGCVEKSMVDEDRSHGVLTLDTDAALEEFSHRIALRGLAQSGEFYRDEVTFADPSGKRYYRIRVLNVAAEEGRYPLTDRLPSLTVSGYIDISLIAGVSVSGGIGSVSLPFSLSATNGRIDYNGNLGWEWDGVYHRYLVDVNGVIHVSGCAEAETALLTNQGSFYEDIEAAEAQGFQRCVICNPD